MGYSIMTPFKNAEERDKMFDFLTKNFVDMDKLLGTEGKWRYTGGPYKNEDIGYGPNSKVEVIGFNYNSGDIDREYAFQMCYWMAKMYGRKKMFKELKEKREYIIYDGCDDVVLISEGQKLEDTDYICTNEIGFHQKKLNAFDILGGWKQYYNKIHEELKRLTGLWKEYIKEEQ
jgi:hypothetical protein